MKSTNISNLLSAIAVALVIVAALGVVAPVQAAPTVKGHIVESSWTDRRIAVRDESGAITQFIIPPKLTIAGSADLHRDSAAFRKHLRPQTPVRVVKGSQLRRSLFAAKDIFPL